jgi:hypothetical protein
MHRRNLSLPLNPVCVVHDYIYHNIHKMLTTSLSLTFVTSQSQQIFGIRFTFEMSASFLGRYSPLDAEQLGNWAFNGFLPDQLWIAPTEVIVNAAYMFVERRDLTLHKIQVLNLDIEHLLSTSHINPLLPTSHMARLRLATLNRRFGVGANAVLVLARTIS